VHKNINEKGETMISSVQSNTAALLNQETRGKNDALGKDDFLQLLVTQLQNQDPLNPMDSTDFTAQLAQFSSLEQLTNVNTHMDEMISAQSEMANHQAVSYIGKNISAYGNSIAMTEGASDEVKFQLGNDASKVFIQIYDANGKLVRNIEQGAMTAGTQSYAWDGLNENGAQVMDGTYNFEVYAFDAQESQIDTVWFIEAPITGITYSKGETYLNSGNRIIKMDDIFKISEN
jgi:flagellar basal-body rod modification protein FlgD